MKKVLLAVSTAAVLALTGCTDATMSSMQSLGNIHEVKCYSGGVEIYHDFSTGAVQDQSGNGIGYESYYTRQYVNTYADCIVHTMPDNFIPPAQQ